MSITDYINKLKGKPGHVRHQIAFGTAAGTTVLVAAGWVAVLLSSHPFAPDNSAYAQASDNSTTLSAAFDKTRSSFTNLLGAVGAANSAQPANIVVETQASTTVDQGQPTVIPF
jgi:hypothetical protein